MQGFLRIGVGKLMLLSGACTVLFWAWLFHRENANSDTAVTNFNISQLNHDDSKQRLMGAENLYRVAPENLGRTVLALAGAIGDTDWKVRRAAASSMVIAIGNCAERRKGEVKEEIDLATAALLRDFHDPNAEARARVVNGIGNLQISMASSWSPPPSTPTIQLGPDAKRVLGPLRAMMKDTDARVRECAFYSYACVAHANMEEPEPILDFIENDVSPIVRTHAIHYLMRIWRAQLNLYPSIIREINRAKNNEERQEAARMLGNPELSPPTPDLLPALMKLLEIDDPTLRRYLPVPLGLLSKDAKSALPALLPLARKEIEGDSEFSAVHAMIAIDSDSSETQSLLPSLVKELRLHADDQRGNWILTVFSRFGTSARGVGPLLREDLKSPRPPVRRNAVFVLEAIGPAAKDALPDLTTLLRTENDQKMQERVQAAVMSINKQ